jgi:hypothetical protein
MLWKKIKECIIIKKLKGFQLMSKNLVKKCWLTTELVWTGGCIDGGKPDLRGCSPKITT